MTTELTPPGSVPKALSAGQTLRQAREQQNLSLAQVAQQLNLSKALIEDLELDQVDAKLSSTFVRGYLRSYAKLLKIPTQQVLDAYANNSKGLHQVPSLTRSFSKRTAKEATENRFMWVTYFVIAVFVVLLVLGFWQSRYGSSSSGTALPMAQTDETMLASEEAEPAEAPAYQHTQPSQSGIPVTQLDHSPASTDTELPATPSEHTLVADAPTVLPAQQQAVAEAVTNTATTETVTAAATTNTPPAATAAETAVTEPVTLLQSDTPLQQNPAPASTELPATTTPAAPAQETPTDAVANASISLSLSAECWVDVVDATGKRLVFGSRQAGEQLNLRGVAPVKVLLGNAAAASLSFNGEAIDLSGYPTGRVARLTLGQN